MEYYDPSMRLIDFLALVLIFIAPFAVWVRHTMRVEAAYAAKYRNRSRSPKELARIAGFDTTEVMKKLPSIAYMDYDQNGTFDQGDWS